MRWSLVRRVMEVWRECLVWWTAVTQIASSEHKQTAGIYILSYNVMYLL